MAQAAKKSDSATHREPTIQERLDAMSHGERIEFLDNNAHRIKECEYQAPLSDEDLDEVKGHITVLSCKKQELEDEKQRFMDEWKAKMKMVEDPLSELVSEARLRKRTEFGKVWDVVDRESGLLYRVAEGNLIVDTRKADKDELAPRIPFNG